MFAVLKKLMRDDSGQDFAEYAIALAIIAAGGVLAIGVLMTGYNSVFSTVTATITGAV